jgi:hypothetical protein
MQDDTAFFAAEIAAEAAAEATVNRLYERANFTNATANIAVAITVATGLAAIALWKSKGGQAIRKKVASAIMPTESV